MMVAGSSVLVTGGAGFIGSHLAERLLRDGHRVRVLDNFATGKRENLAPFVDEIEMIEGDIRSYERVHNAVKGCEVVYHQAALPSVPRSIQDPLTSHATNVIGTLNVLLAARDEGARRVVFASSSSVYGPDPELPAREKLPALPIAPYGVGKLAAEGYCRAFLEVYGLESVALRYFNVFGPRQDPLSEYAAVVPRFISALLEGRPPTVHGDGEQSRDFTYIDNTVTANVLAGSAPGVAGQVFNVACGDRISLNALLQELRTIIGSEVQAIHEESRPGDVKHSLADISSARDALGYQPSISLNEALARTVDHLRGQERVSA